MEYLDAFRRAVRVHRAETAVITDEGVSYTYGEFDRRSTRLATALHERVGAAPVAVLTETRPAAAEAMIAGHKRGAPTVQLSFRATPSELVGMVETTGAAALVFDDAHATAADSLIQRTDLEATLHVGERDVDAAGAESYEDALAGATGSLPEGLPADGNTNVFFTSGTTSRPKAVAFGGEAMWIGASQVVMEHGIDQTDLGVATTPWYHMLTADAWLYPHWVAGATAYLHAGFDPEAVLESIESHGATGLVAVPTQLSRLAEVQAGGGGYDTASLEYVRTAGSVLTQDVIDRTAKHLSENLYNSYGMTEAGPDLTFAHPAVQEDHPGTVGKESFAWELRVVESVPVSEHPDPDATVGPGGQGEIIARGPAVPDGYVDNPEAEEKSFFGEWLRTRDVARVDEDGFLYVVDRVDNMFTSGGENVYPAEVERTLQGHPDVEEALVFGRPDEEWGNRVTAIVVGDGLTAEALESFCRADEGLADYKRPREYAIRTEPLPRTDTGTVQRQRAIDEHF